MDSILIAHVADTIDRVGGKRAEFGYDETADMAARMIERFPVVRDTAARYADGTADDHALGEAVLDALAEF
jgi:hypothetical protein